TFTRELRPVVGWPTFAPDGKSLAARDAKGGISLLEVESGAELRKFSRHAQPVEAVAFSPDGRFLASASSDGTLRLWHIASSTALKTVPLAGKVFQWRVWFSPDGSLLFTFQGSWIDVIETCTGDRLVQLAVLTSDPQAIWQ